MYIITHINQHKFKTKVLQTQREIMQGMMGKRFTGEFGALLFVLQTDNKKDTLFWMKNCIVPLDIVFIRNGKINKIYHNCQPCINKDECQKYPGKGDLVLELPGGTCRELNIKRGVEIDFSR